MLGSYEDLVSPYANPDSSNSMSTRRLKAISVFSGAMGLDIGLEETGAFETLAAIEVSPVFCETIRRNRDAGRTARRRLKVYEGDIRGIDPLDVMKDLGIKPGDLDLLVGGPPCQSFSTSGKRGTVQDPRGTLIWEFLRFVRAFQPRYFLMENVRGLLSAAIKHRPMRDRPEKGGPPLVPDEEPGSVVRLFASDLKAMDGSPYHVDIFEVNAVNYGAPQLRERVLFIGNRFNKVTEFPPPTHGDGEGLLPFRTLGDAIKDLREEKPVLLDFSPRKKSFLSLIPPGGNWRSLPPKIQRESMGKAYVAKGGRSGWWRRLSFDLPSPTILTLPNHASTSLCHPEEVRTLSLLECALVQEFPPSWEFVGTTQEQYTQVGNAVPVRLGVVAGRVLSEAIREVRKRHTRSAKAADDMRVVYIRSHVRTRMWFKQGSVYLWNDGGENDNAKYSRPVTERRVRSIEPRRTGRAIKPLPLFPDLEPDGRPRARAAAK